MLNRRNLLGAVLGVVIIGWAPAAGAAAARRHHRAHATAGAAVVLSKVAVSAGSKTVKTAALVNSSGHAVYMLTGDSTKHPKCTSKGCHAIWPALTSSVKKPALGKGIKGTLSVWRHNGVSQLVLDGHPLYTFSGDARPDTAKGEGLRSFGGTWKVLGASGAAASVASAGGSGHSGSGW